MILSSGYLASYGSAGFGRFLQVSALTTNTVPTTLSAIYIQAASKSTFVNTQLYSTYDKQE